MNIQKREYLIIAEYTESEWERFSLKHRIGMRIFSFIFPAILYIVINED